MWPMRQRFLLVLPSETKYAHDIFQYNNNNDGNDI